jgi:hypothetical protein
VSARPEGTGLVDRGRTGLIHFRIASSGPQELQAQRRQIADGVAPQLLMSSTGVRQDSAAAAAAAAVAVAAPPPEAAARAGVSVSQPVPGVAMPFDQAIASNFEAMIQIGHSLAYKRPAEPLVITRNRDALMRLPHRRWRRAPREGATVSSKAHRTMATHACSGVGYPRRRWTRERTERLLSKLMAIVECASSTAEEKREVARVAVLAATEWAFFRPHADGHWRIRERVTQRVTVAAAVRTAAPLPAMTRTKNGRPAVPARHAQRGRARLP